MYACQYCAAVFHVAQLKRVNSIRLRTGRDFFGVLLGYQRPGVGNTMNAMLSICATDGFFAGVIC